MAALAACKIIDRYGMAAMAPQTRGRHAVDRARVWRDSVSALGRQISGPLGLTPQKPIKRAYERSPAAVQTWLEQTYPTIAERAKTEGGQIHWGAETALVNTDVLGRSYAPKGQAPVTMTIGGKRQKLSMIASVTNQGKARWMIIDGAFKHEKLIELFELLIKDAGRKVLLILDNPSVHHCKPVKAWLAAHT